MRASIRGCSIFEIAMPEQIYDVKTYDPWGSIGYLIGHTRKALLEEMDRQLAPLDVTGAQFIILSQLARARAATAADFCKGMLYDPGAMTRLLDRLEQKGLIRRSRLPGDRRRVTLELTDAGKALCPKMNAIVVRVLNHFLTGFSKAEVRELDGFLRRMLGNANQESRVPTMSSHE
jgi:DNA-binding MarR family transcriptional regulator